MPCESIARESQPAIALAAGMKQIKVRWGDLGSPTQIGTYRCGPHMVEVTPGDIKLAKDNPDTEFTAIHPDFFSAETPYLLTGVELPDRRGEVPTDSFHNTAGNQDTANKDRSE